MKKIILLITLIASISINAQVQKYHKVQMMGDEQLAKQLLQLGITIDHSDANDEGIVAEISDAEVQILKQNKVKYKILIYDLSKFYEARNKADVLSKTTVAGVCNASSIVKPSHFHLGSMGGYFTYVEMQQILDSMVLLYPSIISVKQALSPQSIEGRNIWQVKISDNPAIDEPEPEVLYTSLHHAREAASLSQLIFYMWYLLENYSTNPDIQGIIDNSEMYFVPCVNPDGYVYNQTINPSGGGLWRKNRKVNGDGTFGVDLNRNYGDHWGYDNTGSSPSTSSDTYRGTAAFSEPETQAMRNFCNARQFITALNAHTYSNLLIYPWGYLPSIYTPDSATFVNWSVVLTEDSRFLYGTGDQTVAYVTNGDSDDWMYGEQTSKPKILSMTPEAGSSADGFWPASSRIIDICKTTFMQNLNLVKLAIKNGVAKDNNDKFISTNGYLKYTMQRLSINPNTFTVSIMPVGVDINSVGSQKIYPSLTANQKINDSIAFTLNTGLTVGQTIKYLITVNSGAFSRSDTITKIYGSPITLFSEAGNSASTSYSTSGSWGLSTTKFVSPPTSITDSPAGLYASNSNKSITLNNQVNLSNAIYAHLQYYTRFEIEKNSDKAQILISTNNGGSYTPLCAKYETSPASFGGTAPIYDGFQDDWVKEDIDLSAYIGQNILIRFIFSSNFNVNKDGFYFDDILIRKLPNSAVNVKQNTVFEDNISLSPNPSTGVFNLLNPNLKTLDVTVYNTLGQVVFKNTTANQQSIINIEQYHNGIYFVKLKLDNQEVIKKVVLDK